MAPSRSRDWLDFLKTLPCCVCGRTRNVDPCHTPRLSSEGARGMGQKRNDFGAIPMCSIHHKEQHSIGWPSFIQTYQLDVPAILAELREKPQLLIVTNSTGVSLYIALYRGAEFLLEPPSQGVGPSLARAVRVCSEYLRDQLLQRRAA